LGRKIKLVAKTSKRGHKSSLVFDEENTFVEEGDFKND